MKVDIEVLDQLCRDYCILYRKRFEEVFDTSRESEFTRCWYMLCLSRDLLRLRIEKNVAKNAVGVRFVDPEDGLVLASASLKVNYRLESVLSVLFGGRYREVAGGLYSRVSHSRRDVSEFSLRYVSPTRVDVVSGGRVVKNIADIDGVRELFWLIGEKASPLVAVQRDSRFSVSRVYLRG